MPDRSAQLILEALGRGIAEPGGLPLIGSKKSPGLFPATAAGRKAAEQSRLEGLVQAIPSLQSNGKTHHELFTISPCGINRLLDAQSPKQVLEDMVLAVQHRSDQVQDLVDTVRRWQEDLVVLQATIRQTLSKLEERVSVPLNGRHGPRQAAIADNRWVEAVPAYLTEWRATLSSADCPLPQLFRWAQDRVPELSIGEFHDGLRRLYEQGGVYLHPWTGPLHEMPEPAYAFLTGHEIAYYVSPRI